MTVMLLGARLGEKPGRARKVALIGQGSMVLGLIVLALTVPASVLQTQTGFTTVVIGLFLFIAAFALLEPLFPALLTRLCQQTNRGTAAGIFNMSQFCGAFVGGLISGVFLERDVEALYWILAVTSLLWFLTAFRLEDPEHLNMLKLSVAHTPQEERRKLVRRLLRIRGVEDVAWDRRKERLLVRYASELVEPSQLRGEVAQGSGTTPS